MDGAKLKSASNHLPVPVLVPVPALAPEPVLVPVLVPTPVSVTLFLVFCFFFQKERPTNSVGAKDSVQGTNGNEGYQGFKWSC